MTDGAAPGDAAGEPITLRGERVVLRPVGDGDAGTLLAMLAEPGVAAWWRRAEWEQIDEPGATVFAITVEGEVVGCIQFNEETDPDYHHAALDIFVADAWQDRGIGSDAMGTLARYLIERRGHHRLTVDPAAANERAIHVYERLGFRRVGTMRAYERTADATWRDALLMELIAGEQDRRTHDGGRARRGRWCGGGSARRPAGAPRSSADA